MLEGDGLHCHQKGEPLQCQGGQEKKVVDEFSENVPTRNVIRYSFSLKDVVVVLLVGKGKGVGIFVSYFCLGRQKWAKE